MEGFQLRYVKYINKKINEWTNTLRTEFQLELNEIVVAFYDNPISHRRASKKRMCEGAIMPVLEKPENKLKSVLFSRKLICFISKSILNLKTIVIMISIHLS